MPHRLFDSQIADLRAQINALSKIAEGNGTPVGHAIHKLQSAVEELSAGLLQQTQPVSGLPIPISERPGTRLAPQDATPAATPFRDTR